MIWSLSKKNRDGSYFCGQKILTICLLTLFTAGSVAQPQQTIRLLQERLEQSPQDVDIRLKLAQAYAREGDLPAARAHALRVASEQPQYWDAHLLVARIDGWQGRYDQAIKRLRKITPEMQDRRPANELYLDVLTWAKRPEEALTIIDRELTERESADLHYRRAVAERQLFHYFRAYRAANRALTLNPLHRNARRLSKDTRLANVDAAYVFEIFPKIPEGQGRLAHSIIVAGTFLPRNWLSITFIEEFLRRFATDNNRVTLQVDWRVTKDFTLTGWGAAGLPANAVSKIQTGIKITHPIVQKLIGAGKYIYDRPAWGGHLHRFEISGEAYLPLGFRVFTAYNVGVLMRCASADAFQGVIARAFWTNPDGKFEAGVSYGFGMELDQPVVSQSLSGDFDSEGCPTPAAQQARIAQGLAPLAPIEPNAIRGHNLAGQMLYRFHKRLTLRGGYTIYLRLDNTQVHGTHLGLRTWF